MTKAPHKTGRRVRAAAAAPAGGNGRATLPLNAMLCGDAREVLRRLPSESVHCVMTSPPYWGLRNYGTRPLVWGGDPRCAHKWERPKIVRKGRAGRKSTLGGSRTVSQSKKARNYGARCKNCGAWRGHLGLEPSISMYVRHIVEIFREVRRVLRKEGVLWLNMGDVFNAGTTAPRRASRTADHGYWENPDITSRVRARDLKTKDLVGLPWRVAFALQEDGWYLRTDVVWHKPNPLPESVHDRPTRAHEFVFLMSKSGRYFYDDVPLREPIAESTIRRLTQPNFDAQRGGPKDDKVGNRSARKTMVNLRNSLVAKLGWPDRHAGYENWDKGVGRNRRTVWTISTQPSQEKHYATYPEDLALLCILAGTSDAGACEHCGAPFRRVVDVEYLNRREGATNGPDPEEGERKTYGAHKPDRRKERIATTRGWKRSCGCAGGVRPCVVLDPFMGTGTTALVALKQRRNFVGVELGRKYVRIAEKRVWQEKHQARMF